MVQINLTVDKVCNPNQLEAELRAIPDLPPVYGLSVYFTENHHGLVIYSGPALSQQLRQAALQVIRNHVPDFTEENERQEQSDIMEDIRAKFGQFDEMTTDEKFAVIKKTLRLLLLNAKYNR